MQTPPGGWVACRNEQSHHTFTREKGFSIHLSFCKRWVRLNPSHPPPPNAAYAWWRSLGAPQCVAAPMVDGSELPFRLLCRRYGAQLAYSPMLKAPYVIAANARPGHCSPLLVHLDATDLFGRPMQLQTGCEMTSGGGGCRRYVLVSSWFPRFA